MDAYNIILHNNINNCWQIQEIFMFLEAIAKDVNKLQAGSLRFSIQLYTLQGVSSLRSLSPLGGIILFKTHEQQLTIAHTYVRVAHMHSSPQATPQSILRGVVCETNVAVTCILLRSIS